MGLCKRLEERRRRKADNASNAGSTKHSESGSEHDTGASQLDNYSALSAIAGWLAPSVAATNGFEVDEEVNIWGDQATPEDFQKRLAEFEEAKTARSVFLANERKEERRKKREEKRRRKTLEGLQKSSRKTLECLQKGSVESTAVGQLGWMRGHQQLQNGSSGADAREITKSKSLPLQK